MSEPDLLEQGDALSHDPDLPRAGTAPMKVLVTDDYRMQRRPIGRMIRQTFGLEVIEAGDGQEALDVIKRENPLVVLTDMQMPRMNGLELVAAVRAR